MTGALAWSVRTAGVDDAAALGLIGAATFLESFAGMLDGQAIIAHCQAEHSAQRYAQFFADGAQAWLGEATAGDGEGRAPIGYALLAQPDLPGSRPGDLELKRIYVLSRWHGSGLAAALMAAAAGQAAAAGAPRLLLGVHAGNARALKFYRKQGFAQIGARQFRVGHRVYDDVVLARPLP